MKLRPKEKGSGHALAGQRANNVLNLEMYSFCFLFFYTNSEPIPSPLGKAKEKAETTQLVLADAIPANGKCFVSFPVCVVCFLQID